uniref:MAS-related GPR, member F n=1 Tax=Mus musculus TaxID=10090 RepID=D3Z3Y0_MOUSE
MAGNCSWEAHSTNQNKRGHCARLAETGDLNSAPNTCSASTPHPSAVDCLHLAIWTWLTYVSWYERGSGALQQRISDH